MRHAINNQINDEWLVRDQGTIVHQLGIDPKDFARDLIAREGGSEACVQPYTPTNDVNGPYSGKGNDNEWGEKYADMLTRIMSADFAVIPKEYDRAVRGEYPGGVSSWSYEGADQFWMGLRASFPNAAFRIHHQMGRDDALFAPRAALRWTLHGKHEGWGSFGTPTGAEVFIMGICHAEFGPWGLRREWALIDETAVWKQIVLATGDV